MAGHILPREAVDIKQIQYPDALFEQNEELGWDDLISRLDADLILMADSLDQALQASIQ